MNSDAEPEPAEAATSSAAPMSTQPHGSTAVVPPEPSGSVATLAVIYRNPATLQPDPRNARTHSKQQIEQIEASIRSFGFTNPILIGEAGVIIAGHGRFRAAKNIEMASVPTITLAGLSDAQRRALRLADNKIALGAGWDTEILKLELAELGTLDLEFDLSATGFSTGEIDVILKGSPDPLRANKSETFDCLKFTLEGAGERSDGYARTSAHAFAFVA